MSKEAAKIVPSSSTRTANTSNNVMQRYLQYLRSDPKPLSEEERLPTSPQLDAWQDHRIS